MGKHVEISELTRVSASVNEWLSQRYGEKQAGEIWSATCRQYNEYLKDLPDYGGRKNAHALAIYGALVIFAMYPQLPDPPPAEELQEFVQEIFMAPFVKLGKVINLNRRADMRLINMVFQKVGDKDRKQIKQYPQTFCNLGEPFDKEHGAARYSFSQCPNAEFAKKHGMLELLPVFCNSDFWGIGCLHGTLIRQGTCGNSDRCDYCVVGSENPMAKEYEIIKDDMGFLVSRKKQDKK